jgi:hypothetical protein
MSANESLVTRARNRMVKIFLGTDATHLLFIDADIGFNPQDVVRLIAHNKEVVCGSYPMKGVNYQNLVGNHITSAEQAERLATSHVINFMPADQSKFDGSGPVEMSTEDGLIELKDAGTGFMLIKREVIDQIIEANPQIAYQHEEDGETWWAVFDCEIDENRYLSEDYTFCRRWQRLGGKVWLDPQILLDHQGTHTFRGHPQFSDNILDVM